MNILQKDKEFIDEVGQQLVQHIKKLLPADQISIADILNINSIDDNELNKDISALNRLFDLNLPYQKRDSLLSLYEILPKDLNESLFNNLLSLKEKVFKDLEEELILSENPSYEKDLEKAQSFEERLKLINEYEDNKDMLLKLR